MSEKIMVSVMCTAFNHGEYIRQALEGMVNQQTDFDYEILINDDVSTDNTADIIREFEAKYPEKVRALRPSRALPTPSWTPSWTCAAASRRFWPPAARWALKAAYTSPCRTMRKPSGTSGIS